MPAPQPNLRVPETRFGVSERGVGRIVGWPSHVSTGCFDTSSDWRCCVAGQTPRTRSSYSFCVTSSRCFAGRWSGRLVVRPIGCSWPHWPGRFLVTAGERVRAAGDDSSLAPLARGRRPHRPLAQAGPRRRARDPGHRGAARSLVRRGLRPGGLAPRERCTRFTWSCESSLRTPRPRVRRVCAAGIAGAGAHGVTPREEGFSAVPVTAWLPTSRPGLFGVCRSAIGPCLTSCAASSRSKRPLTVRDHDAIFGGRERCGSISHFSSKVNASAPIVGMPSALTIGTIWPLRCQRWKRLHPAADDE